MRKAKAKSEEGMRRFKLHWGQGDIAEAATAATPYHKPALQLLRFEYGSRSLLFCYYRLQGGFQRSPLIVSETVIPQLRAALRSCPELREILRRLVE